MSRKPYPHEEDEFDHLGADRTPQGVHRSPVPRWRQVLPFVLVIILAPALAFGAVRLLSGGNDSPPATQPTATATPTEGAETEEPTTEPGAEDPTTEDPATEEPTTEEPTDELDLGLSVYVLNGAGVAGLAGDTAARLEEAGWTNVTPENYSRAQPTSTALFYTNADMAAEAEAIGAELGITNLIESADAASNGVVIVLRGDFTG